VLYLCCCSSILFNLCKTCSCSPGVFGDSVSVMEGDSVTLNTDLTEIHKDDHIRWSSTGNIILAEISKGARVLLAHDPGSKIERIKNRLKLDGQTGSLTITNTTTEHTGVYQLEINSMIKSFSLTVYCKFNVCLTCC